MVLHDLGVLEEFLFLLGVAGFGLKEGGGELAEDVGILPHENTSFDILLLVSGGLHLVFLHQSKNKNTPPN